MVRAIRIISALVLAAGVSCGTPVGTTVRLALPGFQILGGDVITPVDRTVEADQAIAIPGSTLDRFEVTMYRSGSNAGETVNLLAAVRTCDAQCEIQLIVEPGEGIAFDFQAYTGTGAEELLLRRGFAVTDVIDGKESIITAVMWPASRYVRKASAVTAPIESESMDIIRGDQAFWLAFSFDRQPFEASTDRNSGAVGGKVEFNFSSMGAAAISGETLLDGGVATHRMALYPSCERFLFGPSKADSGAVQQSCTSIRIPGMGALTQLAYQILGNGLYVRIPYAVIGGNSYVRTDLLKGTVVAGFLPGNGGDWQYLPAAGAATLKP